MNARTIETLKSEGRYYHAGALAWLLGHDDVYGCHYGMRSSYRYAIAEFKLGWHDARRANQVNK